MKSDPTRDYVNHLLLQFRFQNVGRNAVRRASLGPREHDMVRGAATDVMPGVSRSDLRFEHTHAAWRRYFMNMGEVGCL